MNDAVLPFPTPDEERARRLAIEVERLARLPTVELMFYAATESHAAKYGVDCATLKRMVETVVKENDKKRRAEQVEQRRVKARAEKKQEREDQRVRRDDKEEAALSRKEIERERKEAERARKEAEKIEREEEAKRVKREAAFAEIAELPKLTHEVRLKEAAKRLGEDFEFLVEAFEVYFAARTIPEDLEPWPEPVDTAELLVETEAKFRRYVVASNAIVTASTLYAPFTYVAEVATHAPKLIYTFPERDAGKSTALHVERWMVLRGYPAIEATGAVVYRIMDRLRPTLCLDEADSLFKRRTALAHIVNELWSNSGTKIPRTGPHGEILEFDPYGPQVIAMKGLHNMPDTTQSRCIICVIWPKLASERVDAITYRDDDEFRTLRRKFARWAVDNAAILRDAKPVFPPGFNNRIRNNWGMLLAIADLAGGEWPKRVRTAALELETGRDEPSETIRLFAALRDVWGKAEERTSESLCAALAEYSEEWADFHGKGPIGAVQLAAVLRPFGIRPVHNLRKGRRAGDRNPGGYRRAQFKNAWARLLQKPTLDSLTRSHGRK